MKPRETTPTTPLPLLLTFYFNNIIYSILDCFYRCISWLIIRFVFYKLIFYPGSLIERKLLISNKSNLELKRKNQDFTIFLGLSFWFIIGSITWGISKTYPQ